MNDIYTKLAKSEADIAAGRTKNAKASLQRLWEKHNVYRPRLYAYSAAISRIYDTYVVNVYSLSFLLFICALCKNLNTMNFTLNKR